jgi:23S rRNA (adenine2503-C2)-methyltransferase
MKVVAEYGNEDIAKVYVARMRDEEASSSNDLLVEFVESIQPPLPRDMKWVLIVSSMFGCPIKCKMCDAGGGFRGRLTSDEILAQIDYMVRRRFPDGKIPIPKFKIQFARMGEPTLNHAVLDAMKRLPEMYDAPGLHVSLSTVAPSTPVAQAFLEKLVAVKDRYYSGGRFQLQFSIHTTDPAKRDELIPVKKWSMQQIAEYGRAFARLDDGDKKITLNFAPAVGYPIDPAVVREHFEPSRFLIKLTPLNPTVSSVEESLASAINPHDANSSGELVEGFRREGFEVILSIGELEENRIGSNCGQYIQRALRSDNKPRSSYALEQYSLNSGSA